jgi:hypothetical protein
MVPVSGFPWSTLITTAAPVVAALGAVWLRERYSSKRVVAKAQGIAVADSERQVQAAYVGVIKSGRMLAAARRDRDYRGTSDRDVDRQTRQDLVACRRELNAAVAIVDIIGSTDSQAAAQKMLDVSKPGTGQELTAEGLEKAIDDFILIVKEELGTDKRARGAAVAGRWRRGTS